MRNEKGAIAIFTLLAMMFFLVFIMVGYSNVALKTKTQVETTSVLVDEYKSDSDSSAILSEKMAGNTTTNTARTTAENAAITNTANKRKLYSS